MDATWQGRDGRWAVRVPVGSATLEGNLHVPPEARGAVLFAHGSGSSRHNPRNRFVAGKLQEWGLAPLLIDLLTREEGAWMSRGEIALRHRAPRRAPERRGCGRLPRRQARPRGPGH